MTNFICWTRKLLRHYVTGKSTKAPSSKHLQRLILFPLADHSINGTEPSVTEGLLRRLKQTELYCLHRYKIGGVAIYDVL
jgi:hypothetical protein